MSSPQPFSLVDTSTTADGSSSAVVVEGRRAAARLSALIEGELASCRLETSPDGVSWQLLAELTASGELAVYGVEGQLRVSWELPPLPTPNPGDPAPVQTPVRIRVRGEAHQCYAAPLDLVRYGLPALALESLSETERVNQLLVASSIADGPLAAAGYQLPLIAWGDDLVEAVASIAAAGCLIHRGFNPEGSDQIIIERGEARRSWLDGVGDGGRISPETQGTPPAEVAAGAVVVSRPRRGWGVHCEGRG